MLRAGRSSVVGLDRGYIAHTDTVRTEAPHKGAVHKAADIASADNWGQPAADMDAGTDTHSAAVQAAADTLAAALPLVAASEAAAALGSAVALGSVASRVAAALGSAAVLE